METYATLLLECLVSVLLSRAILQLLSGQLAGTLERLCPDTPATEFWLSYTKLMLILTPLFCVLLFDLRLPPGDLAARLRFGVIASLGGLLFGLWLLGRRLGRFIEIAAKRETRQ